MRHLPIPTWRGRTIQSTGDKARCTAARSIAAARRRRRGLRPVHRRRNWRCSNVWLAVARLVLASAPTERWRPWRPRRKRRRSMWLVDRGDSAHRVRREDACGLMCSFGWTSDRRPARHLLWPVCSSSKRDATSASAARFTAGCARGNRDTSATSAPHVGTRAVLNAASVGTAHVRPVAAL